MRAFSFLKRPAVLVAIGLCAACGVQAEGVLAQLYAAKPPAGTSFVRVVNSQTAALRVKIAGGPEQTLSGEKVASTYAIVKGGTEFSILINGKTAATMQLAPGTFTTLIPKNDGKAFLFTAVDDSGGNQDALKAELRFYNLGSDCTEGAMQVASSGPSLFTGVASGKVASRSINPVSAQVQASCGTAASKPMALPALQPGDHYSLFLMGAGSAPVLRGQVSSTDPYRP